MGMTPDQVLRVAAQHWYDRLIDGDASEDYPDQVEDLRRALESP